MLGVPVRRSTSCAGTKRVSEGTHGVPRQERRAYLLQLGEGVRQPLVLERRDVVDEPPHVPREVEEAGVADLSGLPVREVRLRCAEGCAEGLRRSGQRSALPWGRQGRQGQARLEDHGAVVERPTVDVVLGEFGQLHKDAHHDGRDVVDQVLQVRARLVGRLLWRRLARRPRVLRLFKERVDFLRDLRDHAVLSLLERLLEGCERVQVDRAAPLGCPVSR